MSFFKHVLAIILVLINFNVVLGQFYPGGYNPNNYGPPVQSNYNQFNNNNENSIEQKYVNSGQSIMLVCDLPNNMPDGKVSYL